ncbi:hypothetical protein AYI68_g1788 [Smittium mucronatum]|uniref:Uncharacterized protein n=1 Tax=Smittium mucronatum TaxID=133383 RepID=A0A1R0H4Q1_9FUNG|nr:hypothetical protein AYI68_g1788 [Smittium mucronatum]
MRNLLNSSYGRKLAEMSEISGAVNTTDLCPSPKMAQLIGDLHSIFRSDSIDYSVSAHLLAILDAEIVTLLEHIRSSNKIFENILFCDYNWPTDLDTQPILGWISKNLNLTRINISDKSEHKSAADL